ncbi:MAG TPA: tetratricopeptide repeat protein [Blastocatellia bacterium]|jgi:tetratricopeptide (TPR) repeat protein|nr:tetratricopeptide repeat protein [Blastocatellia bacterium]
MANMDPVGHSAACRMCGHQVGAGLEVCEHCGTPVSQRQARKPVGTKPRPGSLTPNDVRVRPGLRQVGGKPPSLANRRSLVIAGASLTAVLALLVIAGAIYFQSASVERRLDDAIAKGNLLTPPGDSAYELYHQLKREGAAPGKLAQFGDKLLPVITARPFRLLKDFADPGSKEPTAGEWEEAQKLLTWASEIKPNDGSLPARASYCSGRIAYIGNRKGEALDWWQRADSQDKSWAVLTNGVGLIYNERRDYASARRYLYEAIRRDPTWAVPYNNIGTSFFFERDYAQAESYYRQCADRAPRWGRPHFWLGDIAMHNQDYARAVQEYESGLGLTEAGATNIDLDKVREKLQHARQMTALQQPISGD